jgi:transcription initiation factor TFIIA small subunit
MSSAVPVFELYRASSIGRELRESLEEFVEAEDLDSQQMETIMQHFDKAISHALANAVKNKAVISGPLHHYRNHDDIWTFLLNSIEVKLDNSVTLVSDEKTNILSVTRR